MLGPLTLSKVPRLDPMFEVSSDAIQITTIDNFYEKD
jgi:hypothetical protein